LAVHTSTWDAVWHANEVRFILDTGQASSTHMGELRNVETHQALYYPSVFHALTAVFCQLTGAAPTTGYTLCSWQHRSGCSGQRRRTHLASAQAAHHTMARRERSGHCGRAVSVVHLGALRRVRRRRDA